MSKYYRVIVVLNEYTNNEITRSPYKTLISTENLQEAERVFNASQSVQLQEVHTPDGTSEGKAL